VEVGVELIAVGQITGAQVALVVAGMEQTVQLREEAHLRWRRERLEEITQISPTHSRVEVEEVGEVLGRMEVVPLVALEGRATTPLASWALLNSSLVVAVAGAERLAELLERAALVLAEQVLVIPP
jgi:hypothetical protein